jgi:hypothetical protein
MGEVVQLQAYASQPVPPSTQQRGQALVPVEFAVAIDDREAASARLIYYGIRSFTECRLKGNPSSSLAMVSVQDAISVNKLILEYEELSVDAIGERIDLIQMLENIDIPMMQSLWGAITTVSHSSA